MRRQPANTRLQLLLFVPSLLPPPNMHCTQHTAHMRASTHKCMAKNRRLHVESRMWQVLACHRGRHSPAHNDDDSTTSMLWRTASRQPNKRLRVGSTPTKVANFPLYQYSFLSTAVAAFFLSLTPARATAFSACAVPRSMAAMRRRCCAVLRLPRFSLLHENQKSIGASLSVGGCTERECRA